MAAILTTDGIRSKDTYNGTDQAWLNSLTAHLYKDAGAVAVTDHTANRTEANFDGYAAIAVGTWGVPALDANNNDLFTAPDITWTMTGAVTPNQIYGVYWTDAAGKTVMEEPNGVSGGIAMLGNGYQYTLSPKFYEGQCATPL